MSDGCGKRVQGWENKWFVIFSSMCSLIKTRFWPCTNRWLCWTQWTVFCMSHKGRLVLLEHFYIHVYVKIQILWACSPGKIYSWLGQHWINMEQEQVISSSHLQYWDQIPQRPVGGTYPGVKVLCTQPIPMVGHFQHNVYCPILSQRKANGMKNGHVYTTLANVFRYLIGVHTDVHRLDILSIQ